MKYFDHLFSPSSGLWNLVFLFSNLSLVFLMPFAYFFTESEGFVGCKKGVMARVYETAVVLLLLTLLVLGMVWVGVALLNNTARESLYGQLIFDFAIHISHFATVRNGYFEELNWCPLFLRTIHENPFSGDLLISHLRRVGVLPALPLLCHLSVRSAAAPV